MNQPVNNDRPSGFDFNYPTIVAILYIASFIVGVTGLIGVILCYIWRGEQKEG